MTATQSKTLKTGDRVLWKGNSHEAGVVIERGFNGIDIEWDSNGQTGFYPYGQTEGIEPEDESKAWSAALLRAARLIQRHNQSEPLTRDETVEAIRKLNHKIPKTERDQRLLTELEATE